MEDYLQLLRQQIEKNLLINQIARSGRDAIAAGNLVTVMEGDALRKQIILQIQSLQSEMARCLETLPDDFDLLASPLKDKILAAGSRLQAIISETVAIDGQNHGRIREIRTGVGEKLEDIGRGKKALSGYKTPVNKKPQLIDGKG